MRLGHVLGFDHRWSVNPRPLAIVAMRYELLIQEDHSFTFKTADQPYRPELDHLPYGPGVSP